MILGYKKSTSALDAYWYGKIAGQDRKFIRVVCGLVLPQFERETGAAVVVAESYKPQPPQDLTVLDVATGAWPEVENALSQLRKDLKFGTVVVDKEANRELVYRIPGMTYGLAEIPCATYAAPDYALSEIGRSKTDTMGREGRLHVDEVMRDKMEQEMDPAAKALFCAVVWMTDYKALYKKQVEGKRAERRFFGQRGL